MGVIEFLEKSHVKYEILEHTPVFSAQGLAAVEHEPGRFVAKPVIVKADDRHIMCVICACHKLDLTKLKSQLDAKKVELADENEIGKLFPDCELGAEPPFGNLYDLPTVVDKQLEKDDHILFQGGTHGKAIRMSLADFERLAEPKVLDISIQN
jgi:Ala-tRNA(Pro) deacylase